MLLICFVASVSPFTGMVADAVPTTMLEPSNATAKAAILKLTIAMLSFPSFLAKYNRRLGAKKSHAADVRMLKTLVGKC
jgi:hypothetical protein